MDTVVPLLETMLTDAVASAGVDDQTGDFSKEVDTGFHVNHPKTWAS
jgi:hypothetical protein